MPTLSRSRLGASAVAATLAIAACDQGVATTPTAPSFTLSCTAHLVEDVTDFRSSAFNDYAMFYNLRFRLEPMDTGCEVRVVISDLEVIQNGRVVWRDRHQLPLGGRAYLDAWICGTDGQMDHRRNGCGVGLESRDPYDIEYTWLVCDRSIARKHPNLRSCGSR